MRGINTLMSTLVTTIRPCKLHEELVAGCKQCDKLKADRHTRAWTLLCACEQLTKREQMAFLETLYDGTFTPFFGAVLNGKWY